VRSLFLALALLLGAFTLYSSHDRKKDYAFRKGSRVREPLVANACTQEEACDYELISASNRTRAGASVVCPTFLSLVCMPGKP